MQQHQAVDAPVPAKYQKAQIKSRRLLARARERVSWNAPSLNVAVRRSNKRDIEARQCRRRHLAPRTSRSRNSTCEIAERRGRSSAGNPSFRRYLKRREVYITRRWRLRSRRSRHQAARKINSQRYIAGSRRKVGERITDARYRRRAVSVATDDTEVSAKPSAPKPRNLKALI